MKKIIGLVLIALLFGACNDTYNIQKHNLIDYGIEIRYSSYTSNNIGAYEEFLIDNTHTTNVTKIKNNELYCTYSAKINPMYIGYDLLFYNYIDTNNIFISKMKFKRSAIVVDRCVVDLYDYQILDTNGVNILTEFENGSPEYNAIIDIVTKTAFNNLNEHK